MNVSSLRQGVENFEEESRLIDLPQVWTILILFVMLPILVLTVLGNITVLVVLRYSDVLSSTVNTHLLTSLSIADLLVAILVMPCALDTVKTGKWRCGEIWRKVNGFGNFLFCISSIMHLMVLSIDRYVAIARPLHYPLEMTKSRALLVCSLTWVYSAIWAFFPLFGVSSYECFITYIGKCKTQDWSKYGLNFVFAISVVSGTYGLALITMVYVYWKIVQAIRSQNRRIENSHNSNSITKANVNRCTVQSLTRKFNTHKGVITLLMVIFVYLLCWSPFCFLLFYEIATGEKVKGPASSVAMMAGFVNSCCNPIIYAIKYTNFRVAVMRMLGIKGATSVDPGLEMYSRGKDKKRTNQWRGRTQ